MTAQTLTRDQVRDTAIRALVTHEKMLRAGMVDNTAFLTTVRPALDAAHNAGWASDNLHPAADRQYGQWLIAEAERRELGAHAASFDEVAAKHRTHIGTILDRDIPADVNPIAFIQHIQDATHALPDSPEWAYDRALLDLAAHYLTEAQLADRDAAGQYRAADEALAALDTNGCRTELEVDSDGLVFDIREEQAA